MMTMTMTNFHAVQRSHIQQAKPRTVRRAAAKSVSLLAKDLPSIKIDVEALL
jgi:hypothetical protein